MNLFFILEKLIKKSFMHISILIFKYKFIVLSINNLLLFLSIERIKCGNTFNAISQSLKLFSLLLNCLGFLFCFCVKKLCHLAASFFQLKNDIYQFVFFKFQKWLSFGLHFYLLFYFSIAFCARNREPLFIILIV